MLVEHFRYNRCLIVTFNVLVGCVILLVLLLFYSLSKIRKPGLLSTFDKNAGIALTGHITILAYTKYFGGSFAFVETPDQYYDSCPEERVSCFVTEDKAFTDIADALLFHWRDIEPHTMANRTQSNWHQYWVLYNMESPYHVGPRDMALNNVFNLTMTYKLDGDIYAPYFAVFPKKETTTYFKTDDRLSHFTGIQLSRKSGWIAWAASNCDTPGRREQLVDELREYLPVEVYGSCGSSELTTESCNRSARWTQGNNCERRIFTKYRFYLSFENSLCKDYATEKVGRVLYDHWNTIPVVYGWANYSALLPPNSFIDVRNFNSTSQLAKFLHRVGSNQTLYQSFFKSRSQFYYTDKSLKQLCHLCQLIRKLRADNQKRTFPLNDFFVPDNDCVSPENFLSSQWWDWQPSNDKKQLA